jgi:ZIP family zinc transporter
MAEAFLWGLAGAASLILGALIVFVHGPAKRSLGLIMGFGAGVLLSAVSFELIDEALTVSGGEGATVLGFFSGALVFYLGDSAIARIGRKGEAEEGESGLSIVLGTVLDGVPESAVLGLTILQTGSIGVSMLVAVFVSNLPEAIAASTSLLDSGWKRERVLALWSGVAVVSALSAAAGYALLADSSPRALAFVLAFAAGAILTMLSTTMIPEAFVDAHRPVGLATTLGFAVALAINWLAATG